MAWSAGTVGRTGGGRLGVNWAQPRHELLRPECHPLRARFDQLMFGMHAPGHADRADTGFPRLDDVAYGVSDQHNVLGLQRFRPTRLVVIGGRTLTQRAITLIREKAPN